MDGKWRIDKRDDRGRTLDVHALRHTFGTLLSKGGVAPRTAQAAMRHSKIDLTMRIYTDPRLLDVHGALGVLPVLPLDGAGVTSEAARATGTEGSLPLVPLLVPTADTSSHWQSIAGTKGHSDVSAESDSVTAKSDGISTKKQPLTIAVSGCLGVEPKGIEPSTSRMPF